MGYKFSMRKRKTPFQNFLSVIGVVLCIVFGFTLLCNLTLIIKGSMDPDTPPSVLGTTPLVVLSGSMSGDAPDHIEIGDLIFVAKAEAEDLKVGNVIAFKQGKIIVTHRIVEITSDAGELFFTTQGDANGTPDERQVSADDLVGVYKTRIPKVGDVAIFMQTPLGMFLFIGVPLLGFIIYDIIRRQRYSSKENERTAELEAEIARLRALAAKEDGENKN